MSLFDRAPHTFNVVTPRLSSDRYGSRTYDYGPAATRTPATGWLQLRTSTDLNEVTRPAGSNAEWILYTRHQVGPLDRIEWQGHSFQVDGLVYPVSSPRGVHHLQIHLRLVEG